MTSTRRVFLLHLAGVSLSPLALTNYVDPLPIFDKPHPVSKGRYRIVMRQFQSKIHRDLPPTNFWGYDGMSPGPTFDVRSHEPLTVEWVNNLPAKHLLPVDHALHGADADLPEVRTVVHLHDGKVPPDSDGNPEKWIALGQSKISFYPNRQDAAGLFYYDHAMAITRLTAVAGLFGQYLICDASEASLHLPAGPYEIPLCIYDRLFGLDGQLQYPKPPWTSEYNGYAILLNGKLFPLLAAEPRPYRFRVLNCSNAGF